MRSDETLVGVGRGHPDVDHRHIGPMCVHRRKGFDAVAGLGHDLAAQLTKDGDDAGPRQEGVVGHDYAHGRTSSSPLAGQDAGATGRAEAVHHVLGGALEAIDGHPNRVRIPPDRHGRAWSRLQDPRHDRVDGRLGLLREPTGKVDGQPRGWRDGRRVADQGLLETGTRQDAGWIPCARIRSSSRVLPAASRAWAKIAVDGHVSGGRRRSFATPQLEREREQELLGAIVEIPLEAASFGLADFDDPPARCTKLIHPPAELQLQALVLDREPRLRPELLDEEVGRERVVVVDQHGNRTTTTDQLGPLAPAICFAQGPPIGPDVPAVVCPVPDTKIRIPDRPTQDRLNRERIVLTSEQVRHLGQAASNRQPVRRDQQGGDRYGHAGSRFEREGEGKVRQRRRGSPTEGHEGGARQGHHGTDDEHGSGGGAGPGARQSNEPREDAEAEGDAHDDRHPGRGVSEDGSQFPARGHENGTVSAERSALEIEHRLVDEGAGHTGQADTNEGHGHHQRRSRGTPTCG